MAIAYLIVPVLALMNLIPVGGMLAWLSLPVAVRTLRTVFTQKGRPLNAALAGTGQTAFLFSLFFWVGLLI
jgi:1,4-dihydroxy-2-naphthoate octaprenyltransferase